jgi:hypothetical protein
MNSSIYLGLIKSQTTSSSLFLRDWRNILMSEVYVQNQETVEDEIKDLDLKPKTLLLHCRKIGISNEVVRKFFLLERLLK